MESCAHEMVCHDEFGVVCGKCGLIPKNTLLQETGFVDLKRYPRYMAAMSVNKNRTKQNLKQNLRKYQWPKHIVAKAVGGYIMDNIDDKKWSKIKMAPYLADAAWYFASELTLHDFQKSLKIPITDIPEKYLTPYVPPTSIENFVYKKYPDEWPETTDISCWYCTLKFDEKPVFLPHMLCEEKKIITYGVFCRFSCAKSFLDTIPENHVKKWYYKTQLHIVATEFGVDIDFILPAPDFTYLKKYGGSLTKIEYKTLNEKSCHPVLS